MGLPADFADRSPLSARRIEGAALADTAEGAADIASIEAVATTAGEFAACFEGGPESAAAAERAASCCCRAETLFRDGRHGEGLELARLAFDLQPEDEPTLRFCAWLFSNCRDHGTAAIAYERLIALRPEWIAGHRHASGSFMAAGDIERAIFHGRRASDRDPTSFEFAFHAGCLYEEAAHPAQAALYLARAAELAPGNGAVLRRLSSVLWAQGERERAIALALRAWRLVPEDRESAHHAAELLLRAERFEDAVLVLDEAVRADPEDDAALRKLSAAGMLRGDFAAALAAIDAALALAPDKAEYHLHRAGLLCRLARPAAAGEAYGRAAALDPANAAARRAQLAAYCEAGQTLEALALGGALIHETPENEDYAEALRHVLSRRLGAADGDFVVLDRGALRPPRQPRPPRTAGAALFTQLRVLHALIIRETRTRFGESRLGYGWALLEPVLHILMLSLFFAVLMHGQPPVGRYFFIFYYTGIIRYSVATATTE